MKSMKALKKLNNRDAITLGVLLLAIVMSDRLKPLTRSMGGKLVLVLGIAYLASVNMVLGLMGVLLYVSMNTGLIEGFKEGNEDEAEGGEEAEPTAEEDEYPEEGFGNRKEGNCDGDDCEEKEK